MQRSSLLLRVARPSVWLRPSVVSASPRLSVASARLFQSQPGSSGDSSSSRAPFVPKPVFSSYKVYKTKTALDVSVVRAQLGWNSSVPEERKYLSLRRAGGLRLTFAAGENRSYDWRAAEMITLSVTELGDLLAFHGSKDVSELRLFHDPGLGSETAGQTRKELLVKRIGAGKPGYFFNFAVSSSEGAAAPGQKKWSIAVSEGEMQVMLAIVQQAIPQLLALNFKPNVMREEDSQQ